MLDACLPQAGSSACPEARRDRFLSFPSFSDELRISAGVARIVMLDSGGMDDTFKKLKAELDDTLLRLEGAKADERRQLLAKMRWLVDRIEIAMVGQPPLKRVDSPFSH